MAVAIDYDGTLAREGTVGPKTIEAVEHLIASGRKLIIVTGRILKDLLEIFPRADLCSRIIAENGAVLYRPETREQKLLGSPVSQALVDAIRTKGVAPLEIGDSILATLKPQEVAVLETIRDLGLEHHVIFNREAVMVLPPGINKATGLEAALEELQLSPHNVTAIGDSENDHALLQFCEYAVAVGNAVPTLKTAADRVVEAESGEGAAEVMMELIESDRAVFSQHPTRHHIPLGSRADGSAVSISAMDENLLVAGSSASGKSTLATGILEGLMQQGYQFCVIDPEGDYESFDKAIVFGNAQRAPTVAEIETALDNPHAQIVVNLVGLPLKDRPAFFKDLFPRLQDRRAKTGRPHRIVVDEAHHLLPSEWQPGSSGLMQNMDGMLFITVHPEGMSSVVLRTIDVVVALGEGLERTLQSYAIGAGIDFTEKTFSHQKTLEPGEALVWAAASGQAPETIRIAPCQTERRRHRRKYAEGALSPDRSFYFRGPDGRLNLRAQNLILFRQMADGVDDATWLYHLREGDYSRWMETAIKDPALAELVHRIEEEVSLSARESRRRIAEAIEERYTMPATGI